MPISEAYKIKIDKMEQKKNKIKKEEREKAANKVKEVDFLMEDTVEIKYDIYNLTIAANMTKNCNPTMLIFCIK